MNEPQEDGGPASRRQIALPAPPSGGALRTEPDPIHQGVVTLIALGVAVLLVVAGGAVGVSMAMRGGPHAMMWGSAQARATQAEPAVTTSSGFGLDGLSDVLVRHYTFARDNADVYAQVPCFCGCQEMLGHRDLAQCFVTPDGAWESHASGCQVCIDESQMLMRMMGRGMGPGMMHDRIVSEFGGPMMGSSG